MPDRGIKPARHPSSARLLCQTAGSRSENRLARGSVGKCGGGRVIRRRNAFNPLPHPPVHPGEEHSVQPGCVPPRIPGVRGQKLRGRRLWWHPRQVRRVRNLSRTFPGIDPYVVPFEPNYAPRAADLRRRYGRTGHRARTVQYAGAAPGDPELDRICVVCGHRRPPGQGLERGADPLELAQGSSHLIDDVGPQRAQPASTILGSTPTNREARPRDQSMMDGGE